MKSIILFMHILICFTAKGQNFTVKASPVLLAGQLNACIEAKMGKYYSGEISFYPITKYIFNDGFRIAGNTTNALTFGLRFYSLGYPKQFYIKIYIGANQVRSFANKYRPLFGLDLGYVFVLSSKVNLEIALGGIYAEFSTRGIAELNIQPSLVFGYRL